MSQTTSPVGAFGFGRLRAVAQVLDQVRAHPSVQGNRPVLQLLGQLLPAIVAEILKDLAAGQSIPQIVAAVVAILLHATPDVPAPDPAPAG